MNTSARLNYFEWRVRNADVKIGPSKYHWLRLRFMEAWRIEDAVAGRKISNRIYGG